MMPYLFLVYRPTVGLQKGEKSVTRIVKTHAVRRDEILDLAQQLLYAKGYEQMTIQDLLDGLRIAKGTFYHYFNSKQALLAGPDRSYGGRAGATTPRRRPETDVPALDTLNRFFATLAHGKQPRSPSSLRCCASGTRTTMRWSARRRARRCCSGTRNCSRRSSIRDGGKVC